MSSKPKQVFIKNDMEGTIGVMDWNHVGGDCDEYWEHHKLIFGDLNPVIEGALATEAEEITFSDSHERAQGQLDLHTDQGLPKALPNDGWGAR